MGKGDNPRFPQVPIKQVHKNYEDIFGKKPLPNNKQKQDKENQRDLAVT